MLSPSDYLRSLTSATNSLSPLSPSLHINDNPIRDEQIDAYTMDVVNAVRQNNVQRLRELFQQGHCLDACNSNGESLLHLACRRCDSATVLFLVREARVNVNCRDRMGRTVLHDTCWRPEPAFEVMDVILAAVQPELMFAVDMRGHSCWDYCRRSDWESWNNYLAQRQPLIAERIHHSEEEQGIISLSSIYQHCEMKVKA